MSIEVIKDPPVMLSCNGKRIYCVVRGPYVNEIDDGSEWMPWEELTSDEQHAFVQAENINLMLREQGNGYVQ